MVLVALMAGAQAEGSSVWQIVVPIITLVLGGSGVAWFKARAEKDAIVAQSSKSALEVFTSSIGRLQEDYKAVQAELIAAREEIRLLREELDKARQQALAVIVERDSLHLEVRHLRKRIELLEERVGE